MSIDQGQLKEESWYKDIELQVNQLINGTNSQWREVIQQNNDRNSKIVYLSERNSELEEENKNLKSRISHLSKESSSKDSKSLLELQKYVEKLESEIQQLKQDELKVYKTHASNAQRVLDLTDLLKTKEEIIKSNEQSLLNLTDQLHSLTLKKNDLSALVGEKEKVIQLLQDEYSALKLEFTKTEEKIKQVENENRVLTERWLRKVNEEADKVNTANQLYESMVERAKKTTNSGTAALSKVASRISEVFHAPSVTKTSPVPEDYNSIATVKYSASPPQALSLSISLHDSEINCIAVNPDGSIFATGGSDRKVKICDSSTGNVRFNLTGCAQSVMGLNFSNSKQLLLGSSNDNSIKLWSAETGRSKDTLTGHIGYVWSAKFTSDSRKIVSGSHDRTIKVWDLAKGACIRTLFTYSGVNDICLTSDSGIISGHADNSIRFWDSNTGECVRELGGIHSGQINSVCVLPDDYQVLTCSRDNTLKIIDLRKYAVLNTYYCDTFAVAANHVKVSASSDGQYIAAGGTNGNVYVWDSKTSEVVSTLKHHSKPVYAVCWNSVGGSILYSADKDHQLCIWK